MADSAPALIWMSAAQGAPSLFNQGWLDFAGTTLAQELECGFLGVHPEDLEPTSDLFWGALAGRRGYEAEYRLRRADGEYRWLFERAFPRFLPDGTFAGLIGIAIDVSERKDAEEARREEEKRFRTLVSNLPGAVFRCHLDGSWTMDFLSDAVKEISGYPASDFLGNRVRTYASILHPDDAPMVEAAVRGGVDEARPYVVEYRILHAGGGVRWVWERGQAVYETEGGVRSLDGVFFDVTDRRRAQEAFERQAEINRHQALHDSLTGLPNRMLFCDRIEQAVLAAQRAGDGLAVLMLDLDRFKEINDTLGHRSGDLLLQELGRRLRTELRASDTVSRLGGDEFGLLLPGLSDQVSVIEAVEGIRRAVERPFLVDDFMLSVEASIGIAFYPEHGRGVDVLLQRADVAMYAAKEANAGHAVYDPEEDDHSPARLVLVGQLRRAVERRELLVHYQPKAKLTSGEVTGVEALVRWQHPERGLVAPDEFIPLAQQTGLIRPITLYVLEEALRQCRAWDLEGRKLSIAVNLSMRNLLDARFPDDLSALLEKWPVEPRRLVLEITESVVVSDPFRTRKVLERLSAIGARISIDDFGTGYSSLGYLKRLPIDEIKIDRSFVMNMAKDGDDAVIVRSTVELAQNLGLEVVAEGVETEEIWHRLQADGCDTAQGYYLSRPVPADELATWLELWQAPRNERRAGNTAARRRESRAR